MKFGNPTRMAGPVFKWLAVLHVAVALLLAARAVSQKKTIAQVNENTLKTLSDMKDQHADFVRHMLVFVTRDSSKTVNVALLGAAWLAVNAVISWRCSNRERQVGEAERSASQK